MSRGLVVVLAAVVAIVALTAVWFGSPSERREAVTSGREASSRPEAGVEVASLPQEGTAPAERTAELEGLPETPQDTVEALGDEGGSESTSTPAANGLGFVVHGQLMDEQGRPIEAERASLAFYDASGESLVAQAQAGARYSIAGLEPGRWWIKASAKGFLAVTEELDLHGRETVLRRDFTLRANPPLKVAVTGPDGRSLRKSFSGAEDLPRVRILAVATLQPPGERLLRFAGGNNRHGVGSFWDNGFNYDALPEEYLGVLQLHAPPPLHVSLVMGQHVLATQPVEPGQEEVRFVLTRQALLASVGSLALRVVDGRSGEPITNACVGLNDRTSWRSPTQVDENGTITFENQQAADLNLTIEAPGFEQYLAEVVVQAGRVLDLGEIALEPAVRLSGRVQGPDGNPVFTRLKCYRFEGETMILEGDRVAQTDTDGRFALDGLRRARYALATYGDDQYSTPGRPFETRFVSGIVEADLRGGPVDDLVIEAVPYSLVLLQPPLDYEGLRFRIEDDRGRLLRWGSFYNPSPHRRKLPPGDYVLVLRDEAGNELERRPFTLGEESVTLEVGGD